jgi:hypothetical protein
MHFWHHYFFSNIVADAFFAVYILCKLLLRTVYGFANYQNLFWCHDNWVYLCPNHTNRKNQLNYTSHNFENYVYLGNRYYSKHIFL